MSGTTSIEWTDSTWNPVRGCSRVSEGCRNCYAERQAARFVEPGQHFHGFAKVTAPRDLLDRVGGRRNGWTGKVELIPEKLDEPLRWRKPRRVFVNSMSDLFHERLSDKAIAAVFGAMASCPQHTFQVLTKRPERMRQWCSSPYRPGLVNDAAILRGQSTCAVAASWPPPNVWLGVSVEDQATADERIPLLLQTPAARRFVSYEPALAAVDLGFQSASCECCPRWPSRWVRLRRLVCADLQLPGDHILQAEPGIYRSVGNGHGALCVQVPDGRLLGIKPHEFDPLPSLDWLIVGGESGPEARPCDLAWVRSAVEQCKVAGVPVFVKQLGARAYNSGGNRKSSNRKIAEIATALRLRDRKGGDPFEWPEDLRVREFPEAGR